VFKASCDVFIFEPVSTESTGYRRQIQGKLHGGTPNPARHGGTLTLNEYISQNFIGTIQRYISYSPSFAYVAWGGALER
jgi:hypothetical protein